MTHIQKKWKVLLIDGGVGLECFAFDPRGEGPYTGISNNILRVVWICSTSTSFAPSSTTVTACDPCCQCQSCSRCTVTSSVATTISVRRWRFLTTSRSRKTTLAIWEGSRSMRMTTFNQVLQQRNSSRKQRNHDMERRASPLTSVSPPTSKLQHRRH